MLARRARCVLAFCALAPAGTRADLTIYDDALAPGWQNWSWGTAVDFASTANVHAGAAAAAVTHTEPWAGFYLHAPTTINAAELGSVRFWIHGGAGAGRPLVLWAYDQNLQAAGSVAVPSPATWTLVEVPLSSFSATLISGFAWQENSGSARPTYAVDDIALVGGGGPSEAPELFVDAASDRKPISEFIYGMNFAPEALAAELRLPVNRWGGNATTRYSYIHDTSNRASDWFFENIPNDNPAPQNLPHGSASDDFVDANERTGTESIITVPLIGWTPKSRAMSWGFSVTKYGAQQQTDPWQPDAGNGVRTSGTLITGNDPLDTSAPIGPGFVQGWIAHLAARYGDAGAGGVRFYNLDNEPMLWNHTHRDVHPGGVGYDELRDRTVQYGAAIKAADPAALTLGPVLWGWDAYFYSALDVELGGPQWWNTRPDRMAHGDTPLTPWYLQQMRAHEQSTGTRILDYLDLHYYPQGPGVALGPAGSAATQALRLRSTRSLWDPSYIDESWIAQPVRLIPRMREWVDATYPGTRLAITEYNWGGHEHINGALAQADVLGIFGREGLDLACLWTAPAPQEPAAHAFRIYRNFDGAGGAFGSTGVHAASTDEARVSVYAAERQDGTLTIVAINKADEPLACPLTLAGFEPGGPAAAYRYSGANTDAIVRLADLPLDPNGTTLALPASSITLLAVPGPACAGDFNKDGILNVNDFSDFRAAYLAGDPRADYSGDGVLGVADFSAFRTAYLRGCP